MTRRLTRSRPAPHSVSSIDAVNLASGLPRLPRAAQRALASREALHAWWTSLQQPDSSQALGRFLVARMSEWLPLQGWALVIQGADRLELAAGPPQRRRLGPAALAAAAAALRAQAHWSAGSLRVAVGTGPDVAAVAWLLRGREEEAGVLVGLDDTPAPRPPDVRAAATALAATVLGPAGMALARVRQLERLQALAAVDDLTGLYNARHLHNTVARELSRLARTGLPLSLVFLDLDAFKRVNDRHGHLLGSRALIEVGALLRACVRLTDTAVRYGGDEFVVVLPHTGRRDAGGVARRIQERVASHTFLTAYGVEVRLTVSVGVATLNRPTFSAADLIRTADEAMYWVKRHGRNGTRAVLLGSGTRPAAKLGPAVPAGRLKRSTTE